MIIFNAHDHFRKPDSEEFKEAAPIFTKDSGGVAMMNFPEPLDITTPFKAVDFCFSYVDEIMAVAKAGGQMDYNLRLMPVLHNKMTRDDLENFIAAARAANLPLGGFKIFTPGTSTNSGTAPLVEQAPELIDAIENMGEILAIHMEDPNPAVLVSDKEESAMENVLKKYLMKDGKQRKMKISLEHLSTKRAVETAEEYGLKYTLTPHHLAFCLEDFGITDAAAVEKSLTQNPYFWCKPVIQFRKNMEFLREHWLNGSDNIMLGTDAAPHTKAKKEATPPMAGIFMGETKASYEFAFPNNYIYNLLERYSKNAADFYGVDFDALPHAMPAAAVEKNLAQVMNVRALAIEKGIVR
ncbi:MAG: hypothetical protein LBG89_02520 [Rickettsiales bacterium]|jgi:dihydroorotase|nr:hypothetical protein [Rickettsiales bacterium]